MYQYQCCKGKGKSFRLPLISDNKALILDNNTCGVRNYHEL